MQPEQYFKDGKQRFGLDQSTVTTTDRLQRLLVALLLACYLLIVAGLRVSPAVCRWVYSRRQLGILHLATSTIWLHQLFALPLRQTGYA